jgi:hypothetical protein
MREGAKSLDFFRYEKERPKRIQRICTISHMKHEVKNVIG